MTQRCSFFADKLFMLLVARLRDRRRCPTNPPFSRSSSCGRFHVDSHCAADTKIKFTVRVYLLMLRANQLRAVYFQHRWRSHWCRERARAPSSGGHRCCKAATR